MCIRDSVHAAARHGLAPIDTSRQVATWEANIIGGNVDLRTELTADQPDTNEALKTLGWLILEGPTAMSIRDQTSQNALRERARPLSPSAKLSGSITAAGGGGMAIHHSDGDLSDTETVLRAAVLDQLIQP